MGVIHVVWSDGTRGAWGYDMEIMYVRYTEADGWSSVTVISDGYNGVYWNNGHSREPTIAVDDSNKLHVAWSDETDGVWGTDDEIMYTNLSIFLTPDSFTLSSTADTIRVNESFTLAWIKSYQAHNYSLYESTSGYINEISGNITIVQVGLTNHSIYLSRDTKGVYYFIVEAINEFGSTLSNCIYVEVSPVPPEQPEDDQDQTDGIPFGNFYLFFVLIGIIGLIVCVKRKLNSF